MKIDEFLKSQNFSTNVTIPKGDFGNCIEIGDGLISISTIQGDFETVELN